MTGRTISAPIANTERATITAERPTGEASGADLPPTITQLECHLMTAFHAFDDIELMTMPHRVRVMTEVTSMATEAAAAASRAGFGLWAESIVLTAAERRPVWSSLCTRWDGMIVDCLDAVGSVAVPIPTPLA